jgi:hypothetical protein
MSKRIAGKTFSSPSEVGLTPPTEEELAEARKMFDQAQERVDRLTEADHWAEVSPKFWDDMSGTEYEGWRSK